MNYFDLYSSYPDHTIAAAWNSQVTEIAQTPRFLAVFEMSREELFPRFVACYAELRALPRSARRALQRRIARSSELAMILPEYLQQGGRRLQHKLAWSLTGAALLLALGQSTAHAVDITVNTTNPAINGLDGKCSLIEAIVNANNDAQTHLNCPAGSGADTILLPRGTHTLRKIHNSTYGPTGLPVISSPITIQGNGARIRRQGGAPAFRLMAVSNSGDLTLQNMTLTGGYAHYGNGGGVFNNGGILSIKNSIISQNRATGSFHFYYGNFYRYGGVGGGVFSFNGSVTIDNSELSANFARFNGGGLENRGGTLTILNSVISGNQVDGSGGGVSNAGDLTIQNSTISGNEASLGSGGGVYNTGGTVNIENSTISGNRAWVGGGGVVNYAGSLTIQNSTISQNRVKGFYFNYFRHYFGDGGGVFNSSGIVTIETSTISGNRAASYGGGVGNYAGNLTIENSTISNNRAKNSGGLWNNDTLTLSRSLISGNNGRIGPEISNSGTVAADNFNLLGANGNPRVVGFTPRLTDIVPAPGVRVGRILGPLKNNGGLTKTHALHPGSPALDVVPFTDPSCAGTDQRGVDRPQGTGCDIGAFERDGP